MINKLKQIINNRICCLMLHGKSIEELEDNIDFFKDKNVCWMSLNIFSVMEDYILDSIEHQLEIVLECSTTPEHLRKNYELDIRIPRLKEFLSRKTNNLWITTKGYIRDSIIPFDISLTKQYTNKILIIDDLFPDHSYMDVPNSATFLIATALAGSSSKIILFGLDGYAGAAENGVNSCYKAEIAEIERLVALGTTTDAGINRDTRNFEKNFPTCLAKYRKLFNNTCEIYNCSPSTVYNCIPKINYSQLKEII